MGSIPKIIHYCWFGNGKKPKDTVKFIKTWKKHLPDYEIIEWNESNFDINCNNYVKQAYEQKKYAFVSDYARIKALYEHGGIYFDTDVEVLKSFDDLLNLESFLGFEEGNYIATSVMGFEKGFLFLEEFIKYYDSINFISDNSKADTTTNVQVLTKMLKQKNLILNGKTQLLEGGIKIFSREYFSPYDYISCRDYTTKKSYAVHHFSLSWLPRTVKIKRVLKTVISKVFGEKFIFRIRKYLS